MYKKDGIMKSIVIKICIILISMIFIVNVTSTYADSAIDEALSGGKKFITSSAKEDVSINEDKLILASDSIYNTLLFVSFIVVAVSGIWLGIKFMMSGVEEKAEVKKALVVFVIGCIVTYGSFGIWKVLVTFLNKI